MGLSEWSPGPSDPNLASVIYASHLGVFGNNGVDFFTPWSWFEGMWETLHLFSRYAKGYSVASMSSLENTVSAYTTVNQSADSMTVIIVNRDMNSARNVTVDLNEFVVADASYKTLQLSSLPDTETFVSHTENALEEGSVSVHSNSFTMDAPALSITAVLLHKPAATSIPKYGLQKSKMTIISDGSFLRMKFTASQAGHTSINLYKLNGKSVKTIAFRTRAGELYSNRVDLSAVPNGLYVLKAENAEHIIARSKILVAR